MGICNMELYHIGHHCSLKTCNRLDYLPFQCDGCKLKFCEDHWKSENHSCLKVKSKTQTGSDAGTKPAKVKKKKQNPCLVDGCKGYNLVPMLCDRCGMNFCVKHRFTDDHSCRGFAWRRRSL